MLTGYAWRLVEALPITCWSNGLRSEGGATRMDSERLAEMVKQLRRCGKRVTRERELLIRVIAQYDHLDADAIHRLAQRENPQIGLATVYRTLTLLKQLDIVTSSDLGESHSHYEARADDHVHLICTACSRVVDVPSPACMGQVAQHEGFSVQRVHLEVFGLCSSCSEAATRRGSKG